MGRFCASGDPPANKKWTARKDCPLHVFRLTLAELRSAAGGFETILFTLFHSRVAGEEAGGLEGGAVALIDDDQGAGDAVADGAGLTGTAAAGDSRFDVDLAEGVGGDQAKISSSG